MSKTTKKSERALANRRRPGLAWLTTCLQVIIDCDPSTHYSLSNTCFNKHSQIHASTNTNIPIQCLQLIAYCDPRTILQHSLSNPCFKIQSLCRYKKKSCGDSFCSSTDKLEQQQGITLQYKTAVKNDTNDADAKHKTLSSSYSSCSSSPPTLIITIMTTFIMMIISTTTFLIMIRRDRMH